MTCSPFGPPIRKASGLENKLWSVLQTVKPKMAVDSILARTHLNGDLFDRIWSQVPNASRRLRSPTAEVAL